MRSAFILLLLSAMPLAAQEAPAPAPTAAAQSEEFEKTVLFGKKFFDLKDYASAYDYFAKAAALQPDNAAVLYDTALVLAKAGRYSEAQTKVDRYLQLYPNGAEKPLINQLQWSLEFQRELQKKRQADQEYADLFTRGRFLYTKNDFSGALKLFEQAEQRRNEPAAVFNQAVIYEKRGDLAKAAERFHRYQELESDADQKALSDQRILLLESELDDMKTKIVCPFCGLRLPIGATWCHRCWHGPYLTSAPVWNSRPCVDGASATRATYYVDDRFAKNDALSCLAPSGTLLDSIRYSPSRQKAIQDARKAEGWTYNGEIIQGQGTQTRYAQGPNYLERISVPATGDILNFAAHKVADGVWMLDREDVIIDGQKYASRYTFDAQNRIAQQQVDYQNAAGCNHVISMTADYAYTNDALSAVALKGGYDGYTVEGSPRVDWAANVAYTYDGNGRVAKEALAVTSLTKTYMKKPYGAERDEINGLYRSMRVTHPIENALRSGDLCAMSGNLILCNPIDLRPFYAMSPNVSMLLPYGVTKATVSFTYPDAYKVR